MLVLALPSTYNEGVLKVPIGVIYSKPCAVVLQEGCAEFEDVHWEVERIQFEMGGVYKEHNRATAYVLTMLVWYFPLL